MDGNATLAIAVITQIVSLGLVAWRAYRSSLLQVYAQTRSVNRKTWMNRIIEDVRDLVVLCKHKPGESEALSRLVTELDMLLNPEDVENKSPEAVSAVEFSRRRWRRFASCEPRNNGPTFLSTRPRSSSSRGK